MKHTQGKWEVPKPHYLKGYNVESNGIRIADNIQKRADAYIIALAPDLLEALKDAVGLLNNLWKEKQNLFDLFEGKVEKPESILKLERVIAKVEIDSHFADSGDGRE